MNVANLLRGYAVGKNGLKLYCSLFPCEEGKSYNCRLHNVDSDGITVDSNQGEYRLAEDGAAFSGGECQLFPSREARGWGVFCVKYVSVPDDCSKYEDSKRLRGFLVSEGGIDDGNCAFVESDTLLYIDAVTHRIVVCDTDSDNGKYIRFAGTRLKLEEKPYGFKKGDVVIYNGCNGSLDGRMKGIGVVKRVSYGTIVSVNEGYETFTYSPKSLRLATEDEIGKWNRDTLNPQKMNYSSERQEIEFIFDTFDRCVMRRTGERWFAAEFSHVGTVECGMDRYGKSTGTRMEFYSAGGNEFDECLPYNDKTKRLIGTTDKF